MNSAAAYRNIDQVVFVIHTEKLARAYEHRILLSPINSGATKPMPHPRSISMFKAIKDFDWNMKRPLRNRVVELTVLHSVPDIMKHVSRIEVWRGGTLQRTLRAPYREDYFAPKR